MSTVNDIKELALHAAKGTTPNKDVFSKEDVNEALRKELGSLASSVNDFMRNRYDIYDIIISVIDDIVPARVIDYLSTFAEVQVVAQGQKALFKRGVGKQRAKKFLTQVGLSGVYETFRLDKTTFELNINAIGGATTIDFERLLDGAESMPELLDIVMNGLTDAVFLEVQKALRASLNSGARPAANIYIENAFDSQKMAKLTSVVRSYGGSGTGVGGGAVIFAPPEFIIEMGPDAIVPIPTSGNYGGVYHPQDIDAIHNTGFINLFRGTPIVQIPQSFVDENNEKTWIDPQLAYVLPTGGERVVKVTLEGATQVNDFKNRDNSMEIHVYKKMGAGILTYHDWGIYQNTSITQTLDSPYGF